MDYIYLRAGRVRLRGWGVKSNFIFLPWGGLWEWGVQNKFEQKIGGGGSRQLFFFFYNLSPDYFFSNVRIRQEVQYRPIKKIQAGWAHGGFNKYLFLDFFSFDAVASVDVYLPARKDKANLIFLPGGGGAVGGSKQI